MVKKILKMGDLALLPRYKKLARVEHRLSYLFWECTMNCNFYCKHCGSSAGRRTFEHELTTTEIKKVFFDVSCRLDPKKVMLAVTGGEPLVRSDLFEVMAYAHNLGFPWGMVTNGFLVTDAVVKKMKDSGMSTVVVSIDSIGKDHDEFRGMPGAYEHAINAVKLLAAADFLADLQITTSVHKGNIGRLDEMYSIFAPLGITSWRVMNVDPIGRAEENSEILLDGEDLYKLLSFIKERRKNSKIAITYGCSGFLGYEFEKEVRDHYFSCNTGISIGSVLYNGDIFVCPNVPRRKEYVQGNVREVNFMDVWEHGYKMFRVVDRTLCTECSICPHWKVCLGGSFHLWDTTKNEPKFCHIHKLESAGHSCS